MSHRDVGVGYSQVVPVLVHALGDSNRVLMVEQPELHLHPALQCDLADLFIEGVRSNGNTFILETHSEYLLYRLIRRIRDAYKASREDALRAQAGREQGGAASHGSEFLPSEPPSGGCAVAADDIAVL